MSKIGIMGGTFNPIHNGHISLAKAALDELGLDKVWFMPSKNPPHKSHKDIASEYHRVNMIKLAIKEYKEFEISKVELEREGITYTSDTLTYLHDSYPNDEFFFIMGADSLINIEKWHCPELLFKLTTFAVASRDDVDINELNNMCNYLASKYNYVRIKVLNMDKINASSSQVRLDEAFHNVINPKVSEYIKSNGLYD